jgi:hypothetical protein
MEVAISLWLRVGEGNADVLRLTKRVKKNNDNATIVTSN